MTLPTMTLPMPDPFICARWTAALMHSLWQGPLILFAAIFLRQLWANSSNYRYGVMLAALVALALFLPVNYVFIDRLPTISFLFESETTTPMPALPEAGDDAAEPNDNPILPTLADYAQVVIRPVRFAPYVAAVYFVGAMLMLMRLSCGIFGGHLLVQQSKPIAAPKVLKSIARAVQRMDFSYTPANAFCNSVMVPSVVGILRPMLLLPFSVASNLTPQELDLLVMHELAHIRRHDQLINLMQRILEAFLFYHPVAWILGRQIRDEREKCCDDMVLAAGSDRELYAQALVHMAEISVADPISRVRLVALAATGDVSQLRGRIMRILRQDNGKTIHLKRSAAFLTTFLAVALLFTPISFSMRDRSRSADEEELHQLREELRRDPVAANAQLPGAWSRLHVAATYRPIEEVELLLASGANPNARHPGGATPLLSAASINRLEIVDLLARFNADVNARNNDGKTAILIAASNAAKDDGRMVRLLCALGADVNVADKKNATPLFFAIQTGHYATVEYLIDRGARMEDLRENGRTPFFAACNAADPQMISLLLRRGANASARDFVGWSTFDVLALTSRKTPIDPSRMSECISLLLEAGVQPDFNASIVLGMHDRAKSMLRQQPGLATSNDLMTGQGRSSLHWAAVAGDFELCKMLLDAGANPKALSSYRRTALHLVMLRNSIDLEMAQLLINAGIAVNTIDQGRATPLHLAAEQSAAEAVRFLLKAGALVNLQNQQGRTAVHLAFRARPVNLSIIRQLIEAGSDLSILDRAGISAEQLASEMGILEHVLSTSTTMPTAGQALLGN